MANKPSDYEGLIFELNKAGIDEMTRGDGGIIKLSSEFHEGFDDSEGSCVINPSLGRKAFPSKFGFNIEESDFCGENFVVLVPDRAS